MALNIHQIERNVNHLSDKLDRELYLKTIVVPTSKLIFTQPFLMKYRVKHYINTIKKDSDTYETKDKYENVCVVKENTNYVILGGNCTSYAIIKLGFKNIKVRVFHPKALEIWVGRRFYKGKQIRKRTSEIIILKNSYDYNENNRKLLWLALNLQLYLHRKGLNTKNWHHEGTIIDTNKNTFLIPEHYTIHEKRQDDEPPILVKTAKNTYLIIDGIERYKQANKKKIEARIFTIYYKHSIMEKWLKHISHEFNMRWNGTT